MLLQRASARIVVGVTLSCLAASTLRAQESRFEAALGYNYLGATEWQGTYPSGLFLDLGVTATSRVGLAVEAAANWAHDDGFDLRIRSIQIGPRVKLLPDRGRLQTHLECLIGVNWSSERMTNPDLDWSTQDHLMLQPGVGADLALAKHFALRAGIGMSFVSFKSTPCAICEPQTDWQGQLRFSAALVGRFGGEVGGR